MTGAARWRRDGFQAAMAVLLRLVGQDRLSSVGAVNIHPSALTHTPTNHRQTLDGFARHYETGEKLPEDLYQRLLAARTYRWGGCMGRSSLGCAPPVPSKGCAGQVQNPEAPRPTQIWQHDPAPGPLRAAGPRPAHRFCPRAGRVHLRPGPQGAFVVTERLDVSCCMSCFRR